MTYAVAYGLAVFQGAAWRAMIRQANIGMALIIMVLSALWLTPVINAHRMSAQNQVDRYLTGLVSTDDLPAWELANAWGKAGRAAVAQLRAMETEDQANLLLRLKRAEEQSRWEFKRNRDNPSAQELATQLLPEVKIWPEGHELTEGYFKHARLHYLEGWVRDCGLEAARPCILVFGPFQRQGAESAMFFVPHAEGGADVYHVTYSSENQPNVTYFSPLDGTWDITDADYQRLRAGGFRIGPATRKSLWLGERELSSNN